MKKIIILVLGMLFAHITYSQTGAPHGGYYQSTPNPYHPANQNAIADGWYMATIDYTSNTGHKATYTLKVAVEDLCVVAIDFGNGGYVHKGRNNSGYHYRGGGLYFSRDLYGNIVSASTTVTITYDNSSWQQFDIYIE